MLTFVCYLHNIDIVEKEVRVRTPKSLSTVSENLIPWFIEKGLDAELKIKDEKVLIIFKRKQEAILFKITFHKFIYKTYYHSLAT